MASDNFERCLVITLKWEGSYSNHPDDPGGPTMKGITQHEYNAWRKRQGKRGRPVRQIEDSELREIYRCEYWNAMDCDSLAEGLDLCAFDAAVNSGVGRAKQWCVEGPSIECLCDARLAYLQRLGRLWRVFGTGWRRRVAGIRSEAHRMAGEGSNFQAEDQTLHAGMTGRRIQALQEKLRSLGYPCGTIDGVFGEQLHRAVIVFQHDLGLNGEAGVWYPDYESALMDAQPMLPKRREASHRDLERAGDGPVRHLNLLQRMFAWLFGASAVAQAFQGESVLDSVNGMRSILEPAQDALAWLAGNRWLLVAGGCVALIAFIRLIRSEHVRAFRNFDYQGPARIKEGA